MFFHFRVLPLAESDFQQLCPGEGLSENVSERFQHGPRPKQTRLFRNEFSYLPRRSFWRQRRQGGRRLRMQLIIVSLALFFLLLGKEIKAQVQQIAPGTQNGNHRADSVSTEMVEYINPDWDDVEVDVLSSYYEQQGNNAAVTGGLGTEALTDFTQKILVSIPLNPRLKLNVDGGYDYYTSASSDRIDPIRSDDSAEDMRVHGNVGVTYKLDKQQSVGVRVGGSGEYDYGSFQGGLSFNRISKNENTAFSAQFQAFIDQWQLIYPIELREQGQLLPRKDRQSFNLSLGLNQVLDKKTQVGIQVEAVQMNGLLSTPFHRVFFMEQMAAKVERLPDNRLKVPVGIRLNRYINEHLIARLYYRYYWDSWRMTAHTAGVELPVRLTRSLTFTPFYRYHQQTAVDYFKPYKEHSVQDQFYTSDHDLAALTSHSYGGGISYNPVAGIFKVKVPLRKEKHLKLNHVDLKFAHYDRSTGLQSNIISFGMGFVIH